MNSQRKHQKGWAALTWVIVVTLLLSGCGSVSKPKVYHVGILSGLDIFADTADGFKARMTELGYIEGQNITYDMQKTNNDPAAELRIAKKFVADQVDMIFAFPTGAAVSARDSAKGTNIPVVFANASIEGNDLVKNVQQPGGNITGVQFPASELTLKRLEILTEIAPTAKRIYAPYDSSYPGISYTVDALRKAAPSLNVTLLETPVTSMDELNADIKARDASNDIGVDAVLIMPTLLTAGPDGFGVINQFALKHRLAIAGSTNNNAQMGAIFSYIPQSVAMGRQAADLAVQIFKGTPAGTIPVSSPEPYLLINYKAAKQLGLTIPEGLLKQASEIIR
jgi:putative ABC transport system substrate-binding protein